jgi:hypothetical protein
MHFIATRADSTTNLGSSNKGAMLEILILAKEKLDKKMKTYGNLVTT